MCGICGIIPKHQTTIRKMTALLSHRGPDGDGYYEDETISLGHRRLAIIDLERGDQPTYNEDKTICIVFNGEIYNYKALRRELMRDHRFYTESDTEVLVHLYEDMGTGCLERLNGPFAFAIWDKKKRELFLARDRLGIKPLYYTEDGPFAFASNLGSLMPVLRDKVIDPFAFSLYLSLGYVLSPYTMVSGIKKLLPGSFGVWKDGRLNIKRYWEVDWKEKGKRRKEKGEKEVVHTLRALIDESVRLRLQADVPVGVLLSGGIDSAVVTAVASKYEPHLRTFTVGFNTAEFDERGYARLISKRFNTDHKEILAISDMEEELMTMMEFVDEPIADESLIPTYLISKLAGEDVKVVLTGEGGDENFAGYPRYILSFLSLLVQGIMPVKMAIEALSPFVGAKNRVYFERLLSTERNILKKNLDWLSIFSEDEKRRLCGKNLKQIEFEGEGIESLFHFDLTRWLPDNVLQKLDRATMANSIEGRVPFLDHRLVSYCAGIASSVKLRGFNTKYLLKLAYSDAIPEQILRRRKHGFLAPFSEWFADKFLTLSQSVLSHSSFNSDYIKEILNRAGDERPYARKLMALLVFELWREREGVRMNYEL